MNKKAFTLVELIIVVIIIGILAALAVPAYQNAQKKNKAKSLFTDMQLLTAAEKIYMTENGGHSLQCVVGSNESLPDCNQGLRLSIRASSDRLVYVLAGVVVATVNFPPSCTYDMNVVTADKPVLRSGQPEDCPAP